MSAPCIAMVDVNMCNSCNTCKNEISALEHEGDIETFRDILDEILKKVPDPELVLKMLQFPKKRFPKLLKILKKVPDPEKPNSDFNEPRALEKLIAGKQEKEEVPDELDYQVKFNALHFVAVHGARHKELNEKMKRILQRCTGMKLNRNTMDNTKCQTPSSLFYWKYWERTSPEQP